MAIYGFISDLCVKENNTTEKNQLSEKCLLQLNCQHTIYSGHGALLS